MRIGWTGRAHSFEADFLHSFDLEFFWRHFEPASIRSPEEAVAFLNPFYFDVERIELSGDVNLASEEPLLPELYWTIWIHGVQFHELAAK